MKLVVFIIGLILFVAFIIFRGHDEKKPVEKQKLKFMTPTIYWVGMFIYWSIIGLLMAKL
jgi:O-antigen ligase